MTIDYLTTGGISSCLLLCVSVVVFDDPYHFTFLMMISGFFQLISGFWIFSAIWINPDKSGWLAALDECHEFVTRFFNNGHPLPGAFSSDRLEYERSNLNKYCAVVVHIIAICFSKKKSTAE